MKRLEFNTAAEREALLAACEQAGELVCRDHTDSTGDEVTGFLDVMDAAEHAAAERAEAPENLRASDAGMVRQIDDIWGVLKAKGVITDEDIPPEVREKLAAREALRALL